MDGVSVSLSRALRSEEEDLAIPSYIAYFALAGRVAGSQPPVFCNFAKIVGLNEENGK